MKFFSCYRKRFAFFILGSLSLFVLFLSSAHAQGFCGISGYAPDYKNMNLSVYRYGEYLQNSLIPIQKITIDSSGHFYCEIKQEHTDYIVLRTNKARSGFYAEPGYNYTITIGPKDSLASPSIGSDIPVAVYFTQKDSLELNQRIILFNQILDDFYAANYKNFALKNIRHIIDSFKKEVYRRFKNDTNSYFQNYIMYNLGMLDEAAHSSKKYMLRNYFSEKVQAGNKEYMALFNQVYMKYLILLSETNAGPEILKSINETGSYPLLYTAVKKADTLFVNDTLCEMVILKGLYDFYYMPNMNKNNIEKLIDYISNNGTSSSNKQMAESTLMLLRKLQTGDKAPEFILSSLDGNKNKLSDYLGKPVYIYFWASWCKTCLQEMRSLQRLQDKYGDKIQFINISIDKTSEEAQRLLHTKGYVCKWPQLYSDNDELFLEQYKVKSIPAAYFVDAEGYLLNAPAPLPSEGADKLLHKTIKRKR